MSKENLQFWLQIINKTLEAVRIDISLLLIFLALLWRSKKVQFKTIIMTSICHFSIRFLQGNDKGSSYPSNNSSKEGLSAEILYIINWCDGILFAKEQKVLEN